jgi:hypothetical protein
MLSMFVSFYEKMFHLIFLIKVKKTEIELLNEKNSILPSDTVIYITSIK